MSSNIFEKWTDLEIKNGTDAAAAMLEMVLEDMQAAGLIDLQPDKEANIAPEIQVVEMRAALKQRNDSRNKNTADVWAAPTRLRA